MVKAIPIIKSAIQHARSIINALTSAIHAVLPSNTSKIVPSQSNKKRKMIAKKDVRLMVRRKLQMRQNGNALGLCSEDDDNNASLCNSSSRSYSALETQSINKKFTQYLSTHEDDLACSVCRSLMLLPTITSCDHVFCLECIQNSLVVSNRCPLCRAAVAGEDNYGIYPLRPIEKLIQIRSNREEECEQHRKRLQEHETWRKNRFLEDLDLVAECLVDVWKADAREWKKGEILVREEGSVLVSFQNLPKEQNEIIELPTLRLAKYGFYSNRYHADDFTFPDLHFRNSVRVGSEFQFSILPSFRRSLHQRLTDHPFRLPPLPIPRSNPFRFPLLQPAEITVNLPHADQPEELGRLQMLSPEELPLPIENQDGDVNELLPNLNPQSEFRRQAESSQEDLGEHQEIQPLIDHHF